MIRKNCNHCGKFHWVQPSTIKRGWGKYCSKECHDDSRRESVECICKNCGDKFTIHPSMVKNGQVYCSNECKWDAQKNGTEKECNNCGKKIYVTPTMEDQGQGKYCSRECQSEGYKTGRVVECDHCGDDFYRSNWHLKKELKGNYCSYECFTKDKTLYPNTIRLRNKVREKNKVQGLDDVYIKSVIKQLARRNGLTLKSENIPDQLVDCKREHLKLKRKIKHIKQ